MAMPDRKTCRDFAFECFALAKAIANPQHKAALLQMARAWLDLAEAVETLAASHQALIGSRLGITHRHFGDERLETADFIGFLFGGEGTRMGAPPHLAPFDAGKLLSVLSKLISLGRA